MKSSLLLALLCLAVAGINGSIAEKDHRTILGFTDSQGRHYPRGPPMTDLYAYNQISDEEEDDNQGHPQPSPAALYTRLPAPKKETKGTWQKPQSVMRTHQWGSVKIPYRGATVFVAPTGGSPKAYRGTINTTVLTPEQIFQRRRHAEKRSGNGIDSSRVPCIRCPSDRAVVASKGRDKVLVEHPEISFCKHSYRPKLHDLHMEWMAGPKPGTLADEGTHQMVMKVSNRHRQLQKCRYQYTVIVRKCPPLMLNKYLRAECSSGNVWGSECHLSCKSGYHMRGHASIHCRDDLTWSHALPHCEATSNCPLPMSPENGRLNCLTTKEGHNEVLPDGTVCRYKCNPGYVIPDSDLHLAVISCERGEWNSTADPRCQEIPRNDQTPEVMLQDKRHRRRHRDHRAWGGAHRMGFDPCQLNPCLEGGTCLHGPPSAPVICICPEHRQGEFCERARCKNDMCGNGGQCVVVGEEAVCYCRAGFSGLRCQTKDPS